MTSKLTQDQVKTFSKSYVRDSRNEKLVVRVRFDDQCGNGHNTFSITGDLYVEGLWKSGGCLHNEIAERFPELAPLIKWHLCSTDGPMHYIANTVYQAGDRDHWGCRKGEFKQSRAGRTGKLMWRLDIDYKDYSDIIDADECPAPRTFAYKAVGHMGEGKERELDAARSSAVWPDATDEDLSEPGLKERLEARLPALMDEFRKAVESLGFTW